MILMRVSKVFEVPNWHGFVGIDLHELRGSWHLWKRASQVALFISLAISCKC